MTGDSRKNGNGVTLRALEPEDLDTLYKIENDTELWQVGVTNVPYSRYTLHEYIANAAGDIYTDKQVRMIAENAEGHIVGIVDITEFDPRHMRAELGIVIQKPFRRQGYATAALRSIIGYAKDVIHLNQLYAVVDSENRASLEFFKKSGFSAETTLKDWLFTGKNYRNAVLMQYFL